MKKVLLFLVSVIYLSLGFIAQDCNFIYVSTVGTGAGTMSDPTDLTTALAGANMGDIIRLDSGTYVFSAPLNVVSGITLEGGFIAAQNWKKFSTAGLTKIYRDNTNAEGPSGNDRLVAFYGNSATNFRFQDITIETADASTNRTTVYGVHLTNCSSFYFTRTQVIAGQGGAGINGQAGGPGLAGSPGQMGGPGDLDSDCSGGFGGRGGSGAGAGFGAGAVLTSSAGCLGNGRNGANGATSTNPRSGGGGGAGGGGGEDGCGGYGGYGGGTLLFTTLTNRGARACGDGNNGGGAASGANGPDGVDGAVGPNGTYASGFFVPGGVAPNGTDGRGGKGGGGGGGGSGQRGTWVDDGAGSGGGGGGGGGQGGEGGKGGSGGGGSFGVYLYNNGNNTYFVQCNVSSNGGGAGGVGGVGGLGGAGGARGLGNPYTNEVGAGGNGGNGGAGGKGGKGGNGTTGDFALIYLDGGTAPLTQEETFDLVNQPLLTMDNNYCLKDVFNYTFPTPNAWVFGPNSNPIISMGTNGSTEYTDLGRHDVTVGTDLYAGFNYVSEKSPNIADAGRDSVICDNNNIYNLWANAATNGTGTWTVLSGTSTIADINDENSAITLTEGLTVLEWRIDGGNCCGWTADTVQIDYNTVSIIPTSIAGNQLICVGDTITLSVSSGQIGTGANWQWYEGSCGGTPIGTGPQITISPNVITTYFVSPENGNCPITPGCYSETVNVGSTSIIPNNLQLSQQNICGHDSTTIKQIGGVLAPNEIWYWSLDSCGGQTIGFGDSIVVAPMETTTYYLRAGGPTQCEVYNNCISVTLNVISPMVTFEWKDTICGVFDPVDLSNEGSPTGGVFSGPGISNNVFEPALVGAGITPITYTYYDDVSNCYVPIYDFIPVFETCDDVTLVNTITPNGDGVNDVWNLDLGMYSNPKVVVYNKWGSIIFESNKSFVTWDATYMGEPVASGTYYYIVKFGDEKPQQSGSLTVVR